MLEIKQRQKQISVDKSIKQLLQLGRGHSQTIDYTQLAQHLEDAKKIIANQPALLDLLAPIKVIGSVHGHFDGLLKLFELGGWPSEVSYLFLGNYVDYGEQSLETIMLLLLYKIKYPNTFFLLKGSHQIPYMHKLYGFHNECLKKTNENFWKSICQVLACLPYAAVIDRRIFCVSGGIGPELATLKEIQSMDRDTELMTEGPEVDLIWSDPTRVHRGFSKNLQGLGMLYGRDSLDRFLGMNGLDLLCRSRQVVEEGFEFMFDQRLLSLFSAPNFQGQFNNSAAILAIGSGLKCQILLYRPKKQNLRATDIIH